MLRTLALLLAMVWIAGPLHAQNGAQDGAQARDLLFEADAPEAAGGEIRIPRSYALIIGVAQYQNLAAEQQLQFAERDADAIYSVLISPEGGNFPAQNVQRLIGPNATLANIRERLEVWLPSVATEDDRVLIYFAGHGFVRGGEGYLAPYDFDPARIETTGYSMDALGRVFGSAIRARWKVLLTDACHSGAILPAADVQTLNRNLLDLDASVFSLTASRDRELSFESPDWGGGHGIFTYYVVRGLGGEADESGDGVVTADELAEYVRRNVRDATGGRQNPTSERASFDPNMLLAYVPARRTPATPPPPRFGALIFESNMDDVEVFVDGRSVGVVSRNTPLRLPGLMPGVHVVQGVHMGYEPDGPREEIVYPGQETTVSLRLLIPRRRAAAAEQLFNRGLDFYTTGNEQNYRRAIDEFRRAIELDASFSQAELYMARSYHALFDYTNASAAFRRAIAIDPDYREARSSFAGMLLDVGDADEAIRQLNTVVQREADHAQSQYLLAQAFRMKDAYDQAIAAGRAAIRLAPENAEAHFWLAESLRMAGHYGEALTEYDTYLRLSDFDSKLAGKLNYYVLGFLIGKGKKSRAAQHDIWEDLRSLAYFGLCDAERKLQNYDAAIRHCQRSLSYDPEDPYSHYALGLSYAMHAQSSGSLEYLAAARKHFQTMLDINEYLAEAGYARTNIANIDALLQN